MGTESPRIAVVVPSWNCLGDLRECLASLDAQTGVELEVVVVDNGSSDGSVAFLQQHGIKHVPLPRNLGFAAAVNLGIEMTTTEMVATLNSDTVLEPGALAELYRTLAGDPGLGGVQPRILSLKRGVRLDPEDPEARIYSLGQALTLDGRAREDGIGQPQGERGYEAREIFGVCGAACMFRRDMLRQVGGFEESYFAFYEDVEMNVRARIAGWRFRLVPTAVVWHVGNAAWHTGFDRPDAENARLVARNRISTQVRFMPLSALPRIAAVEVGAMFRAALARRFVLTSAGKVAALVRLPQLLRIRRRLRREGDLALAQTWLGESHRSPTEVVRHPVPPVGTPPPA
ncbi:MAG: glycosyltransferase family 2 protein [Solirubrobacterales bacterium]|nr:glycosyltransferase family 2 protein [Solirubrobacterales bacterium]